MTESKLHGNWSRLAPGMFHAKYEGHYLAIAGSRQEGWSVQIDGHMHKPQRTKADAMAYAERQAAVPVRWLSCACCGESVRGRQWWNRDTGYGVCKRCADWNTERYGEGSHADSPDPLGEHGHTTLALYGVRGYHFAVEEPNP